MVHLTQQEFALVSWYRRQPAIVRRAVSMLAAHRITAAVLFTVLHLHLRRAGV